MARWIVAAVFLFLGLFAGLWLLAGRRWSGPDHGFGFDTGLGWPENATVLSYGNSYGGLCGDGEKHLVFEVDETTIAGWLAGTPPWHA